MATMIPNVCNCPFCGDSLAVTQCKQGANEGKFFFSCRKQDDGGSCKNKNGFWSWAENITFQADGITANKPVFGKRATPSASSSEPAQKIQRLPHVTQDDVYASRLPSVTMDDVMRAKIDEVAQKLDFLISLMQAGGSCATD